MMTLAGAVRAILHKLSLDYSLKADERHAFGQVDYYASASTLERLEREIVALPVPAGTGGQDRKFGFRGDHFVNRVSGERIPHDEPVILFRARDRHAYEVLRHYLRLISDPHHREAVKDRMQEFAEFERAHPDRMKEPGITRDIELDAERAAAVDHRELLAQEMERSGRVGHAAFVRGGGTNPDLEDCLRAMARAASSPVEGLTSGEGALEDRLWRKLVQEGARYDDGDLTKAAIVEAMREYAAALATSPVEGLTSGEGLAAKLRKAAREWRTGAALTLRGIGLEAADLEAAASALAASPATHVGSVRESEA